MNNKNKVLYAIVALVVILAVGFYVVNSKDKNLLQNGESETRATLQETNNEAPIDEATPPGDKAGDVSLSEAGDIMAPDVQVVEVTFDGTAYSPNSVTIKQGDVVVFKNNSDGKFWPASAFHPAHLEYPEFDPKEGIEAGGEWQFKFEKKGLWKYHDHIKASIFGSVTVE